MKHLKIIWNWTAMVGFSLLTCFLAACVATHSGKDTASKDLFNGKDLNGWYTYQKSPEATSIVKGLKMKAGKYVEPIGLNKDPLDVFTVVLEDGQPAIRISGETFGILVTDEEYENYHLSLEFKWGNKKFPPREDKKRDSGVLYHSIGKEGAWGGVWMKSIECQVQEGDVGDLICVDSTAVQVRVFEKGRKYEPTGELKVFYRGGSDYCDKSADFEKEHGEWNLLELYVYERESIHIVNGEENMHLYNIGQIVDGKIEPLTKGKIQLQSEGAEIFYRNIRIEPIREMPILNKN
ncbi:MAG TPA: DUF1080 domain-containing protein [Mariniflexile sp.]